MKIAKVIAGVACTAVALLLPGMLAVLIATNLGFGRTSATLRLQDICLAIPFALFALGLIATGLFLIFRRHSALSRRARRWVAAGVVAGVLPALAMLTYICSRSVTAEEAVLHNLRLIEAGKQQEKSANSIDGTSQFYRPSCSAFCI